MNQTHGDDGSFKPIETKLTKQGINGKRKETWKRNHEIAAKLFDKMPKRTSKSNYSLSLTHCSLESETLRSDKLYFEMHVCNFLHVLAHLATFLWVVLFFF